MGGEGNGALLCTNLPFSCGLSAMWIPFERAIKPFMAEHGYTFPALYDPSMNVARQFGVRLVPTTYVVNREGVIVGAGFGPVDLTSPEVAQYLAGVRSAS